MASKIKVNLDVGKDNFILVKCKQNDDISLECNVFENGVSIDLTNYSVGINARKSDNTFIIQNTDIVKKNNNIVAQLFRDFSRLPGLTLIEVILNKEGRFNTSFNINLEVIPSVTYEAIKKSSNTVTITEELQDITTNATLVRDELDALIKAGNVATKDEVNLKANQTEVDTINTELNNKANKTEINQLADGKLDKVQLNDTQTTNNNIWSAEKVNQMISAIPKGEKGDPGTASTSIDDSVTNTTQTWSSKKISDEMLPYYKSVYTSIYPIQGTKIHFEEVNEDIYMSFTTIRMIENPFQRNITLDNCKADIPDKIATSPLGKECVKLINGECFAYDMSANKLIVVDYMSINKNQLPIFCNVNGEGTLGHLKYDYLNDKILKNQSLIEHNNDLWYISQLLYIEPNLTEYCNYVKWDELIRRVNGNSTNFSWAELKADINDTSLFVTTPSGETDCLKVDYDYALVLDTWENKMKIVNRYTEYNPNRYTLLLFAPWGRLERGILSEIYTFNRFPSLEENMEFLTELSRGNVLVPRYWRDHITRKIKTISDLQSVTGLNEVSFGFITDMHMWDNSGNSGILLEKVMKECNITYFINGGDYVSGAGIVSKENIIEDIRNCYKTFSRIIYRQLITFGNHDASYGVNNNYDSQLSNGEIYNYIFRENQRRSDIVSSPNGTYYYADDKINKIRYIILNSQDVPSVNNQNGTVKPENNAMGNYVIRQEQFNWLIQTALQTPNDTWSIVVCTHISPRHNIFVNADILMKTLDAYKYKKAYSGTSVAGTRADLQVSVNCNFTGKGGNVVAVISGHMHEDKINTAHNTDIQLIETLNDSMNVWDKSPVKTKGTTTEQAFDIFTINKATRIVNITRIGAGENRQFRY